MRPAEVDHQLSAGRRSAGLLQGAGQGGALSDQRQTQSGIGRDVPGSNQTHDRVPATEHEKLEHHIVWRRRQPNAEINRRRGGNQYGRANGGEKMQLLDT